MRANTVTPPVVVLHRADIEPEQGMPAPVAQVHPSVGSSMPGDIIHLVGPLMPEGAEDWPKRPYMVMGRNWFLPIDLKSAGLELHVFVEPVPTPAELQKQLAEKGLIRTLDGKIIPDPTKAKIVPFSK